MTKKMRLMIIIVLTTAAICSGTHVAWGADTLSVWDKSAVDANNVGKGRGVEGISWVMQGQVPDRCGPEDTNDWHSNSIHIVKNSDNWIEIGWVSESRDGRAHTLYRYMDKGEIHIKPEMTLTRGQYVHFKVEQDIERSRELGKNVWRWFVNGDRKKSTELSFYEGFPMAGSAKDCDGNSNYAHWNELKVKRSQGDYRYWNDLKPRVWSVNHLDCDGTTCQGRKPGEEHRHKNADPDGYYLKKISNSEFYFTSPCTVCHQGFEPEPPPGPYPDVTLPLIDFNSLIIPEQIYGTDSISLSAYTWDPPGGEGEIISHVDAVEFLAYFRSLNGNYEWHSLGVDRHGGDGDYGMTWYVGDTPDQGPSPEGQLDSYPTGDPIVDTTTHPNGVVIKGSGEYIYRLEGGMKRLFPSIHVYSSYGYDALYWTDVMDVSDSELSTYPEGPPLGFREGTLIKGSGVEVYVISDGTKRFISSAAVFEALGYEWGNILDVTDAELAYNPTGDPIVDTATHPNGAVIKGPGANVYRLESGMKRLFPNPNVYSSYGYDALYWTDVIDISDTELDAYPEGPPLGFRDGTLAKGLSKEIYVISDGAKRFITSAAVFEALGYRWDKIYDVEPVIYLQAKAYDTEGNIGSASELIGLNRSTSHVDGSVIRGAGENIYRLEGGAKRFFPSLNVYSSHGYDALYWTDVIDISDRELGTYPEGPPLGFRDGTLIKGSGVEVYVISDGAKRFITSAAVFEALGYDWGQILNVSDAELAYNPTGDPIVDTASHPNGAVIKGSGENIYRLEGGMKRLFPNPDVYSSYGYDALYWTDVIDITDGELSGYPEGPPLGFRDGTLAKGSGEDIYVMTHGEKRPVDSMQVFLALGYDLANVQEVPDSELVTYPTGDPLTIEYPWTFVLSVSKAGTGSGTVTSDPGGVNCGLDCWEPYASAAEVTLIPTADTGSTLTGWSGDPDCSDGQVTMEAAKSCTATFDLLDTTAPSIPQNVIATPTDIDAAILSWDASTDTGGSGLAGYKVYDTKTGVEVADVSGTSHTLTSLVADDHSYFVKAYDVAGNVSGRSRFVALRLPVRFAWQAVDIAGKTFAANPAGATAKASFIFEGDSVTIDYGCGLNTGIFEVSIDGAVIDTVDAYCSTPDFNAQKTYQTSSGGHTIEVRPTGSANPSSSYYWTLLDGFEVAGEKYEETDGISYTWQTVDILGSTFSANPAGATAYAAFTYSGDGVSINYGCGLNTGTFDVELDGALQETVDAYCSTPDFAAQKTYATAPSGTHTITVRPTGDKNASSSYYWTLIDSFEAGGSIYQAQALPKSDAEAQYIPESRLSKLLQRLPKPLRERIEKRLEKAGGIASAESIVLFGRPRRRGVAD